MRDLASGGSCLRLKESRSRDRSPQHRDPDNRRRAARLSLRARPPALLPWFIGWHFAYIDGHWGRAFLFVIAFGPTLGIWWLYEGVFKVRERLKNQRHEAALAALRDIRAIAA